MDVAVLLRENVKGGKERPERQRSIYNGREELLFIYFILSVLKPDIRDWPGHKCC